VDRQADDKPDESFLLYQSAKESSVLVFGPTGIVIERTSKCLARIRNGDADPNGSKIDASQSARAGK
jgi:hypothetical protein